VTATEPEVSRILVVNAHPDDVDFVAAGSVAAWTDAGIEVTYCIVTDGDAGGSDRTVSRADMAALRRREQTEAASVVGVTRIEWLGFPDGRLEATLDLRRAITRVIRQVRPDRVLCPSPERNYTRIYASHPDHLAAGEATLCAVYPDSRNPFAFPELLDEGLEPHTVPEVWMLTSGADLNRYVDITDTIDRKVKALRCHASQLAAPDRMDEMLRMWAAANAAQGALGEGRLAEAFLAIATG